MRILVVEDELDVARSIARRLGQSGFAADCVGSIDEAKAAATAQRYALVLLDRRLPDGDGLTLLPILRQRRPGVRVLVVTAVDEKRAVVEGLDAGADDYLVKPFDSDELLARVRSTLRRSSSEPAPRIEIGAVSYDPNLRNVAIQGRSVIMHGRELALFEVLLRNSERMVSRETIIEEIYGFSDDVEPSALNSLIMRLRRRLERLEAGVEIHMARGVGYMLTRGRVRNGQ
jgi:DNA-binding response OmpR family regulator